MTIDSDMKAGGESLGTISRNYEGVGISSVYPYFQQLFRLALRGHSLPFQRISSKCAADSQHTSCGWRHDHAACGNIRLDGHGYHHEEHHDSGANHGELGYRGVRRSNHFAGQPSHLSWI